MNELWTRFDGMGAVGRVSARLGLVGTTPPANPAWWGQTVTTAVDVATLLRHILDMPAGDRDPLISALAAASPVAADGFRQDFGLLTPGLTDAVAAKQGWMCCVAGRMQLHTAGITGPHGRFVVVVMSRRPATLGWESARRLLTDMASAAQRVLLNNPAPSESASREVA
ncbi:hypothetical protein VX037_22730 [Gordonia sp. Z-3]|uniref:hypothetical protein n=1 Tax=Gordonia sp. Z-3 TaxID=3115408 RepID=UPI002E286756|nr:hypothetical protein [Gordonia sp. Z-3]MED5803847.1 hypothetical protein [Gordonia sp. Z-3]